VRHIENIEGAIALGVNQHHIDVAAADENASPDCRAAGSILRLISTMRRGGARIRVEFDARRFRRLFASGCGRFSSAASHIVFPVAT